MSITDELREYARTWPSPNKGTLLTIADRIDTEHQNAEDERTAKCGQSWLHGYEECRLELMEGNEAIAASLEEAGWVKLPLDADGKVIHVGDVMDTEHFGTVEVEGFVHNAVAFYNYSGQPAYLCTSPANLCHHHEPTIEDVLREFGDKYCDMVAGSDKENELFAEYTAKLQLKEPSE